jgi:hypothetical protein
MTDRVKLRKAVAERDDHIANGSIGAVVQSGYPHFHWIGHNRVGPYAWASKGRPSNAVLVSFDQGDRWCWPSELVAA